MSTQGDGSAGSVGGELDAEMCPLGEEGYTDEDIASMAMEGVSICHRLGSAETRDTNERRTQAARRALETWMIIRLGVRIDDPSYMPGACLPGDALWVSVSSLCLLKTMYKSLGI